MNSTTDIIATIKTTLSPPRMKHSINTSIYARYLTYRYSDQCKRVSVEEVINASLFHDICREWKEDELVEYTISNQLECSELELQFPILLHAPVAADLMNHYPLLDKEGMKKAVRWHSLGHKTMGLLGALLYCSDYMELGRSYLSHKKREELLRSDSIETLTQKIIGEHIIHMSRTNKEVASFTHELYSYVVSGGKFL